MRRVILLGLCASVAIGTAAWLVIHSAAGKIETIGARDVPATSSPQVPVDQPYLSFLAVGDTGAASTYRSQVVAAMKERCRGTRFDFVILAGDNFYKSGVTSTEDPLWDRHFEQAFPSCDFDFPFYACLGNHDVLGNAQAQVDYSNDHPRWRMPGRYHSFTRQIGDDTEAAFFILDTTSIDKDDSRANDQLTWLRDELRLSKAQWKIVVGHHPVLSGGSHGPSHKLAEHLAPLLEEHHVDLYISGHDHDLQIHDSGQGWMQVVSGAGSQLRSVRWIDSTLFAEATPGFAWVMMSPRDLWIEMIATEGHRFTHHLQKNPRVVDKSRS